MKPSREERIRRLVAETSLTEEQAAFAVAVADGAPGDVIDDSGEEPPTLIEAIARRLAKEREESERPRGQETPARVA